MDASLRIPDHHRAHRARIITGFARWSLKMAGWRVVGHVPDAHKLILAVGPHTSNWDFIVGITAILSLDMRVYWLGKHTLFHWPLGPVMHRLGGMAVDRRQPGGVADNVGRTLRGVDDMIIAITPEGTRSRVERMKTGFVRIAGAGGCPVLPVTFDFACREIRLHDLFWPGADPDADAAVIRDIFATATPRYPANF